MRYEKQTLNLWSVMWKNDEDNFNFETLQADSAEDAIAVFLEVTGGKIGMEQISAVDERGEEAWMLVED
jgi:hypothetical protein